MRFLAPTSTVQVEIRKLEQRGGAKIGAERQGSVCVNILYSEKSENREGKSYRQRSFRERNEHKDSNKCWRDIHDLQTKKSI